VACLVIIVKVLIVIQSKKCGSQEPKDKQLNQRILIKNATIVNEENHL
jgi:hypothetical protein